MAAFLIGIAWQTSSPRGVWDWSPTRSRTWRSGRILRVRHHLLQWYGLGGSMGTGPGHLVHVPCRLPLPNASAWSWTSMASAWSANPWHRGSKVSMSTAVCKLLAQGFKLRLVKVLIVHFLLTGVHIVMLGLQTPGTGVQSIAEHSGCWLGVMEVVRQRVVRALTIFLMRSFDRLVWVGHPWHRGSISLLSSVVRQSWPGLWSTAGILGAGCDLRLREHQRPAVLSLRRK